MTDREIRLLSALSWACGALEAVGREDTYVHRVKDSELLDMMNEFDQNPMSPAGSPVGSSGEGVGNADQAMIRAALSQKGEPNERP